MKENRLILELNDLQHVFYILPWFLPVLKGCGVGNEHRYILNQVDLCRAFLEDRKCGLSINRRVQ